MSQGIIQYVKSFYDDFVPPWKWEIPPPTKKNKSHYKKTLSRCQTSQYFLAALAIAVSVGLYVQKKKHFAKINLLFFDF